MLGSLHVWHESFFRKVNKQMKGGSRTKSQRCSPEMVETVCVVNLKRESFRRTELNGKRFLSCSLAIEQDYLDWRLPSIESEITIVLVL